MPDIVIHPPIILSKWIPQEKRKRYIYMMEIYGGLTGNQWDVTLEIILKDIKIRKFNPLGGLTTTTAFKIGCSEMDVAIYADQATKVLKFTPDQHLKGKINQTLNTNLSNSLTISPSVTVDKVAFSAGSYNNSQAQQNSNTIEFECYDTFIKGTSSVNDVEWQLRNPKTQQMFDSYMKGNLLLEVSFEWPNNIRKGTIGITPRDLAVFESKSTFTRKASSIAMFFLRLRGFKVKHRNRVKFEYEIK